MSKINGRYIETSADALVGNHPVARDRTIAAGWRRFARHFLEMVVAMLVGMGALEGLAAVAFAVAGSDLTDQPGALRVMLMGINMTIPMVLWMGYRGHAMARSVEMAASMLVPSALAAALASGNALGEGAALALQHAVMLPAMLGVMAWRYDAYARPCSGLRA